MLYIVKVSGEIPLKSHRTRPRFESKLVSNILEALRRYGLRCNDVKVFEGIIYADCDEGVEGVIKDVFGVHKVCKAFMFEFKDLSDICRLSEEFFKDVVSGKKFAVRVKRVGQHKFTSVDVARAVGEVLRKYSSGVDLDNPQVEVFIEVRGDKVYFYRECWQGVDGLPIGVEGKVLMLVSGGFDSVVASWLIAKRGVEVDILHYIMGSYENLFNVLKVIKKLAMRLYGYNPKIFLIDLSTLVSYILKSVRSDYRQVVLRRFMYLIALELARRYGYDAVGTGESLGQASSQTLKNLRVIEESLPVEYRLPILRPLISMDKDEIIKLAKYLSTYEDSSKVLELCNIASGPVTTRADLNALISESSKVGVEVVSELVNSVKVYDLLSTDVYDILREFTIELDFIPDNAVVVDVRDKKEFEVWHYPNAVSIYDIDISELPKDRPVIIYCDSGQLSSVWASTLRAKGINAFSFKGGLGRIKSCVSG
jgi:thiamine biosynthesis protein ThiI